MGYSCEGEAMGRPHMKSWCSMLLFTRQLCTAQLCTGLFPEQQWTPAMPHGQCWWMVVCGCYDCPATSATIATAPASTTECAALPGRTG